MMNWIKTITGIGAMALLGFYRPESPPRILLAGDSTMAEKPTEGNPERGWGQLLPEYLQASVVVENHAVNGRSTRSFRTQGHWSKLLASVRKDDWVLIQFGHNDSKADDTSRYAAPHTDYRANLTRMVQEVRQKGGRPVLITPVIRRRFEKGRFADQHGDYPDVVRQLARSLQVPLIDLHQSSRQLLEQEGEAGSKRMFLHIPPGHFSNYKGKPEDNTHFSAYGAQQIAALVCKGMRQIPGMEPLLRPSDHPGKYAYELPKVYRPHFRQDTLSITAFGAVSDAVTLNTAAIQRTIDTLAARGGGTVLVPSGMWLTGPIRLRSNINLHLAANATLQFTSDFSQYPLIEGNWEGEPSAVMQSPIRADNAENIAITGTGIIDGNGDRMRMVKKDKLTASQWKAKLASGGVVDAAGKVWYPTEKALLGSTLDKPWLLKPGKKPEDFEYIRDFLRPNLVVLEKCRNILLEGVTFQNSTAWCLHPLMSEHITVRNIKVKNPWYAQNGDGIDVESCRNVLIENSVFDVGDDALCMKSGRDASGRARAMPTRDVVIRNCTVYHAHGGFVIGSEMSGGVENMFVSHCTFLGTDIGLRFKTVRGRGGLVRDVFIHHIHMRDIPGEAILFDMYYAAKDPIPLDGEVRVLPKVEFKPVDETTPQFRDFEIGDVFVAGAQKAIFIRGLPEQHVRNVSLKRMVFECEQGIDIQEATGIRLENIEVRSRNTQPVVDILNSSQISFANLRYTPGAELLFRLSGDRCGEIRISETDAGKARKPIVYEFGASPKDVAFH